MTLSIRLAALLLALIQGVGLCACRFDDDCHSSQTASECSCPACDHDSPYNSDCAARHQQLHEARINAPVSLDFVPAACDVVAYDVTTLAPALTAHQAIELSPPRCNGDGLTLPLLN